MGESSELKGPVNKSGERTIVRDMCFIGVPWGGNACSVDVKDGKVLRIRPAHFYDQYTKEEVKPWVMHARGKTFDPGDKTLPPPFSIAYKKRVYSPARIRFPMKRVDFDPTGAPDSVGPGGRNVRNRGVSKYVRISWDEALDIVTGEMLRVKKEYGATAVLYQNDQHGENKTVHGPHGCGRKLLDLFGGYTHQVRNADSWEGWYWGAKHVWGCEPIGQQLPQKNLLYDISKNAELLLFWGCDQETTTWGWGGQLVSRFSYWWTELGIKQIYIAPDCNYANAVHADRWIPLLPNTDAALYLAVTHRWFTRGTYDKAYLETHAYGVDKFEAYVMGEEDGVPKSPEWAAPITGVPARIIRALADEWASKRTTIVIGNGGPAIRGPYSTEPARLQALCLAMQGLGKPGCNQAKMIEWALARDPENQAAPKPLVCTNLDAAYRGDSPPEYGRESCIPKTLVPKLILEGEGTWFGNRQGMRSDRDDQFIQYKYPADGAAKIRMIWTDSPSWITCWNDGNNFIRAMRHPDIDFILCQHPWIENDALFADVILPVNTKLEEDDIGSDVFSGQMDMLYPEHRCMESLGESCSDYEVVCKIAERLGMLEEYTGGLSIPEIIKLGYQNSGSADKISLGRTEREGLLRGPHRPGVGEDPGRTHRVLRRPREAPAVHSHRQAGVLLHRAGRALPRRRRAPAGAALGGPGRVPPGDHRDRAEQEVSAAGDEQPPALGRALPARRRQLVPRDRDLQDPRLRRIPIPSAVDECSRRRRPGYQAWRRGFDLQRAGDGPGGRIRDRAHHGWSGGDRPRGQVRPDSPGRDRPGWRYQHHRATQLHVEEHGGYGGVGILGRGGKDGPRVIAGEVSGGVRPGMSCDGGSVRRGDHGVKGTRE